MSKINSFILLATILAIFSLESVMSDCACHPIDVYDPVCGKNGVTYVSIYKLKCDNFCNKTNIEVAHKGPCSNSG